jgi:hypothetical protein
MYHGMDQNQPLPYFTLANQPMEYGVILSRNCGLLRESTKCQLVQR